MTTSLDATVLAGTAGGDGLGSLTYTGVGAHCRDETEPLLQLSEERTPWLAGLSSARSESGRVGQAFCAC